MKVLTLWQPWATLLADPALPKWIETRPRRTNVRGRIAIHAAARRPASFWLDTWRDERPPEPFRSLEDAGFDLDRFFDPFESSDGDGYWRYDYRWSRFRFGAVIGTVDLYDCVPIDGDGDTVASIDRPRFVAEGQPVVQVAEGDVPGEGECPDADWTDQVPYGDFTPGRWAWLTRDAVLFPEPIPAKGKQGWWEWES